MSAGGTHTPSMCPVLSPSLDDKLRVVESGKKMLIRQKSSRPRAEAK